MVTQNATPKIPFASKISKVTLKSLFSLLTAFNIDTYKLADKDFLISCREMLTIDPVSRFCTEIIFLYLFSIWGDYTHDSSRITKDIRNTINNCKGSWSEVLRRMCSCYWYGYSWSQVAVSDTVFSRKILSEIYTFDPLTYEFVLKDGVIKKVRYYEPGLIPVEINYDSGVHLVVGVDTSFDYELGSGRVRTVLPYWELHKIIMPVLAIAGQRQATPILVKKTETNDDVIMIDQESGLPEIDPKTGEERIVKKGWDSVRQLEDLGVAGVTAIDRDDEIYAVELLVSADLLNGIVKLCEQYRMIGFLIPVTLFSITNSGVGDAGLAETQKEIFELSISSMANFLNEEIIEKLIRPLIVYNFGEQNDYGSFEINERNPLSMQILTSALDAVTKGKPELEDLEMMNRIRNLLGISNYEPPQNKA